MDTFSCHSTNGACNLPQKAKPENGYEEVLKFHRRLRKRECIEPADQLKLFEEYRRTRDLKLEKRLTELNARLVTSRIMGVRYFQTYASMDLVSEGTLGLQRAVKKFDPSKGFKFVTYAIWWIDAFVRREIKQSRSGGVNTRDMHVLMSSLDVPVDDESSTNLIEMVEDTSPLVVDLYETRETEADVRSIMNKYLPEYDRTVLVERIWNEKTLNQIGLDRSRSRERIRQVERRALARMKRIIDEKGLDERLDEVA